MSADAVIASIRENYHSVNIIGTDIHPEKWLSTVKYVDFFYTVPEANSSEYLKSISEICMEYRVDYIIPLTDPEVDVLSENRNLHGVKHSLVTLPDNEIVKLCRNKDQFANRLKQTMSEVIIPTYSKAEILDKAIEYPIVAKPKNGRSSEGFQIIYSRIEAEATGDGNTIFQPFIEGRVITVDFVRDLEGNIVSLPRIELIRTSNGAGLTVEVIQDKTIEGLVSDIADELNLTGCMNIEFIQRDEYYYLMDINPRFSAGVGFSKLAGYDFIKNHLKVFRDEQIEPIGNIKPLRASKIYSDVILETLPEK